LNELEHNKKEPQLGNIETSNRADVIVVGAGNAALSAATSAAEAGARVIVLEKAPKSLRGGNTWFTGDIRFPWDKPEELFPLLGEMSDAEIESLRRHGRPYTKQTFYDDIMNVTGGRSDPDLLKTLVDQSYDTVRWMAANGHRWVGNWVNPSASHALRLNGGGAALSDQWFQVVEAKGVDVRYECAAVELRQDAMGGIAGIRALGPDGFIELIAPNVVLASGGFEANAAMRAAYLGPGWDTVKVRGTPFNTGEGLTMALAIGAVPCGQWTGCHATPQDFSLPPAANRAASAPMEYRRHEYPWSIMVNKRGDRFVDEAENLRALTYAKVGREILRQPDGVAFQIFDKKAMDLLAGAGFSYRNATMARADTLEDLAEALEIDPERLTKTVAEYNAAVQEGEFDPSRPDGKRTKGLAVEKSNWALTLDEPPYEGYATVCGITFTFGGLKIDTRSRVIDVSDRPIPGLFAAGEIVGGLFYDNYPGGSGMTAGALFGRIAGAEAAARVSTAVG
jgi:tricarballylate dehydrogenase